MTKKQILKTLDRIFKELRKDNEDIYRLNYNDYLRIVYNLEDYNYNTYDELVTDCVESCLL